jgi:hypothetical protein
MQDLHSGLFLPSPHLLLLLGAKQLYLQLFQL